MWQRSVLLLQVRTVQLGKYDVGTSVQWQWNQNCRCVSCGHSEPRSQGNAAWLVIGVNGTGLLCGARTGYTLPHIGLRP